MVARGEREREKATKHGGGREMGEGGRSANK